MKLSELKEGQRIPYLKLKVIKVYPIREVKNGALRVQDIVVSDNETEMTLSLWKENCGKVKEGDVKIFTSLLVQLNDYNDSIQLSSGFYGKIQDEKK